MLRYLPLFHIISLQLILKKVFTLLLPFAFLTLPFSVLSQNYHFLRGYVYNQTNEAIFGASIRIVSESLGTKTDENGKFELKIIEGISRISVSSIGYETEIFEVVMESDKVQKIFLKINQKQLDEVVIKAKKKDYSYEVIKNVLENKSTVLAQYQNFKCDTYIKSLEESRKKTTKAKKEDTQEEMPDFEAEGKLDSLKIYKPDYNLFECKLTRYENREGQQKEEKEAVKKIGKLNSIFFKSITDGEFNLYKNHQKIPKIGDNEITSPLSDLTFLSYKFQMLKFYYEGDYKIYQIKVSPRELGNALYEGTIEVLDNYWVLKRVDLKLTKRALLLYDEFTFKQEYEFVKERWMPTKTIYNWKVKEGGVKKSGSTLVVQSDFEFDISHPKRFFGNEVGTTKEQAYKRDSVFWEAIRPQPLSIEEQSVIKEKEKLDLVQNSKAYLDSVDKVYNKISLAKIIYLGIGHTNRVKKQTWFFEPAIALIDPLAIGGWRIRYGLSYYKRFENRKQVNFRTNLTYGFLNRDLKGSSFASYTYNPIRNSRVSVGLGSGFNVINGAATIRDIAKRNNFYQNKFIDFSHRTEVFNGFYSNLNVYFEKRSDLASFKLSNIGDKFITNNSNYQVFETSYVYKSKLELEYTPGQLFLREPKEKIILGSKYPTFRINIERAWPIASKNTANYTYFSSSITQTFNVGIIGSSEYRFNIGKFIDTTNLALMDYKYQRGGDNYFFSPPMYTFQLIPKTFKTNNWFFEGHYVHQFNGFLTSKIPLFNKTKIREVAGGGLLYVPERKYLYVELFFGLNRVLKIGRERFRIGAYYVAAQSNDFGLRNGFKFSFEPYNRNRNSWSF
jgi:hypothetical protein